MTTRSGRKGHGRIDRLPHPMPPRRRPRSPARSRERPARRSGTAPDRRPRGRGVPEARCHSPSGSEPEGRRPRSPGWKAMASEPPIASGAVAHSPSRRLQPGRRPCRRPGSVIGDVEGKVTTVVSAYADGSRMRHRRRASRRSGQRFRATEVDSRLDVGRIATEPLRSSTRAAIGARRAAAAASASVSPAILQQRRVDTGCARSRRRSSVSWISEFRPYEDLVRLLSGSNT